jgi:hypothetical protein
MVGGRQKQTKPYNNNNKERKERNSLCKEESREKTNATTTYS